MANWSYLCATNRKVIYPSYGDRPYSASNQTVASETYCVPLLWLGLFRPSDLAQRTFTQDDETLVAEAPLCARKRAIGQFNTAVPYLEQLFDGCGPLDEFAVLFRKALDPLPYRYLTIELDEIASMARSREEFGDTLRAALAGIGSDLSAKARERFVYLAQLFKLRRFPPARMYLDKAKADADDCVLHGRIIGSRDSGRKVPWY